MRLESEQIRETRIFHCLSRALESQSSDLHLVAGYPPMLRTFGELRAIDGQSELTSDCVPAMLEPIVSATQQDRFAADKDLDYAIELDFGHQVARFRVNLFLSNGTTGACLRVIPSRIPDFGWTQFPVTLARSISELKSGLVLFTGVTGSGKSTSLALIIELLNQESGNRILTIEDPIEYRFPNYPNSVVTQREVGTDVASFADGLKYGLRQDPDVILVGEIRDSETARMALSAAETGHLVLSTLHTRDAKGAISRYADLFPQQVQNEIRAQLAINLRCVVCQKLLPSILVGEKQELAIEVMFNTSAISSAIRVGKLESVDNYIMTGRADGMIPMDESIKRLLHGGNISREVADRFVSDRAFLVR
jgi:twitching motility protein PilT